MKNKLNLKPDGFRPSRENWIPSIRTIQLSNNFLCFYEGRDKAGEPVFGKTDDDNWPQVDMDLGVCCYVLFNGNKAVVFDTLIVPEQAQYVRNRLEAMGIEEFTVINTHMDMDHTGGNAVFEDCEIIALRGTYEALLKHRAAIEQGKLWGPPAVNPLVLPNTLIDADEVRNIAGFELQLLRVDSHQEGGSLCVYIPQYKALIVGDVAEDAAVFANQPKDLLINIEQTKRLMDFDVDYVFPMHGNPDKIARGYYDKRLINAAIVYQQRLYDRVDEAGYLDLDLQNFIADLLKDGSVQYYEAYDSIHRLNLKNIHSYWLVQGNKK